MIDDGIGFHLVPWQPVLDKRIGQHISGTVRAAGGIEWSFGRKRGLGLSVSPTLLPACRHEAGPIPSRPRYSRARLRRLAALTGRRGPGQGSLMLLRLGVTRFAAGSCGQLQRRGNPPLKISTAQVRPLDFRRGFPRSPSDGS